MAALSAQSMLKPITKPNILNPNVQSYTDQSIHKAGITAKESRNASFSKSSSNVMPVQSLPGTSQNKSIDMSLMNIASLVNNSQTMQKKNRKRN